MVGGVDFASGCGGSVNNGEWGAKAHANDKRLRNFHALMNAFRSVRKFKAVQVNVNIKKVVKKKDDKAVAPSAGRCGKDWTAANNKCGATCTTDAQCSGSEKCYGGLKKTPCVAAK